MKTFAYKGYSREGRRNRGLVEASDLKEARERLSAQGIWPDVIQSVDDAARLPQGAGGMERMQVRATLYRELAALLKAGLTLVRGLELLMEAPDLAAARQDIAAVRDRIRGGQDPATAFADAGGVPGFERSVLEAGQRAGGLDGAMERLADFLEDHLRTRDRLQSAMLYPVVVAVLALVASGLLLGVMLPNFARMWSEARIPLPTFTRVVMATGQWMGWVGLPLVVVLLALIPAIRRRLRRPDWAARKDRVLHRMPLVGPSWNALVSARFGRTLALLLDAGVPLLEALSLAGRATGSCWVETQVGEVAEQVRHGAHLAEALRMAPPLAGALTGWVQAGEAGGALPRMLMAGATRAHQQWERRMDRATRLLEPALIIVLGGLVFVIALAVLLPILSLNSALAG